MVAVMKASRAAGARAARVLRYADSGDAGERDKSRVVGYLAAALLAPRREQRGATLPALARHAIAERLGRPGAARPPLPSPPTSPAASSSPCAGGPTTTCAVASASWSRASRWARPCAGPRSRRRWRTRASRRSPWRELPSLTVDVSVLGPLAPSAPEAVEVGRHGVVVRHDERSALFLPQVATEQGWDRETLLRQLCRKAGLPPDAWRHPDAGCSSSRRRRTLNSRKTTRDTEDTGSTRTRARTRTQSTSMTRVGRSGGSSTDPRSYATPVASSGDASFLSTTGCSRPRSASP